eukprot:scaffold3687_cov240-Pinguiococcus_pyrenoidosus.AAC.15
MAEFKGDARGKQGPHQRTKSATCCADNLHLKAPQNPARVATSRRATRLFPAAPASPAPVAAARHSGSWRRGLTRSRTRDSWGQSFGDGDQKQRERLVP